MSLFGLLLSLYSKTDLEGSSKEKSFILFLSVVAVGFFGINIIIISIKVYYIMHIAIYHCQYIVMYVFSIWIGSKCMHGSLSTKLITQTTFYN